MSSTLAGALSLILAISVLGCTGRQLDLIASRDFLVNEEETPYSLTCAVFAEFSTLYTIRLLQQKPEMSWQPIAVSGVGSSDDPSVKTGKVFVTKTWSSVSLAIEGRYRCDVIGYMKDKNNTAWSLQGSTITVTVHPPLNVYSIHDNYETVKKRCCKAAAKVNETLAKVRRENEEMKKKLGDMVMHLKNIRWGYTEKWPRGKYSLFETRKGCPADVGVKWIKGSRTIHTESLKRNRDTVSIPINMKIPVLDRYKQQNLFVQSFCSVKESNLARPWPKGSYCIMAYKDVYPCPDGFSTGSIFWDAEDVDNVNSHSGSEPGIAVKNDTKINYCCRSDGRHDLPIHLPTAKDFFLLRHGGHCQKVDGMKVSEQYVFFDTKNNSAYTGATPDGREALPDVRLRLCFYKSEFDSK